MAGGFAAAALAMASFTQIKVDSSYATHVLPGLIVMSVGVGFAFVALNSTALIGVDDHDAGVASALVNTTQQVGGSLGIALLNTIAATATANYIVDHGAASAERRRRARLLGRVRLGRRRPGAGDGVVGRADQRPARDGSWRRQVGDGETAFEHAEELGAIL